MFIHDYLTTILRHPFDNFLYKLIKYIRQYLTRNEAASRVIKVFTVLKEHVANTCKENTNEVQLSLDESAAYNIELVKQEKFLKCHYDIANGISAIVNVCHCSAASDSKVTLSKHNVNFKEVPFE